jgi:hypothetical protein
MTNTADLIESGKPGLDHVCAFRVGFRGHAPVHIIFEPSNVFQAKLAPFDA